MDVKRNLRFVCSRTSVQLLFCLYVSSHIAYTPTINVFTILLLVLIFRKKKRSEVPVKFLSTLSNRAKYQFQSVAVFAIPLFQM